MKLKYEVIRVKKDLINRKYIPADLAFQFERTFLKSWVHYLSSIRTNGENSIYTLTELGKSLTLINTRIRSNLANRTIGFSEVDLPDLKDILGLYHSINKAAIIELNPAHLTKEVKTSFRSLNGKVDGGVSTLFKKISPELNMDVGDYNLKFCVTPEEMEDMAVSQAYAFNIKKSKFANNVSLFKTGFAGDLFSTYVILAPETEKTGATGVLYRGITKNNVKLGAFMGATTQEKFRNRGYQSALIRARLNECSKLGIEFAIVETAPGSTSERNLVNHGFTLLYNKQKWIFYPKIL